METKEKSSKTELTEYSIQQRLHLFLSQPRYILDNLYVFGWESDLLLLTNSGYWYELEVKISRSDFKNDFKHKVEKHTKLSDTGCTKKPNYFYYAVPEGMITVEEVPDYAGLIHITPTLSYKVVKSAPKLHKEKNKPENMHLVDKFYYNMRTAQRNALEARRAYREMENPYQEGFHEGKKAALSHICLHHKLECPNYGKGFDYMQCKLKGRECNCDCEYMELFETKMRIVLNMKE